MAGILIRINSAVDSIQRALGVGVSGEYESLAERLKDFAKLSGAEFSGKVYAPQIEVEGVLSEYLLQADDRVGNWPYGLTHARVRSADGYISNGLLITHRVDQMVRQFLFSSNDVTTYQVRHGVVGTGWTDWVDIFDHTLLRNVDGNPHPQYGLLSGAHFEQLSSPDAQFDNLQVDSGNLGSVSVDSIEINESISAHMQSEYEQVVEREQRTSQVWGRLPSKGPSVDVTTNASGELLAIGGATSKNGEIRVVVEYQGELVFQGGSAIHANLFADTTYTVFLQYRNLSEDAGGYAEFWNRWLYVQRL